MRRTHRSSTTGSQAGYNIVILLVILTGLTIAVTASLPLWSAVSKRDREAELISRGLQYAEAIRVFQVRFQRLPVRLEELIEVKPRCIRQLWKDPMTEDGEWAVVLQGGPGAPAGNQQGQGPPGEQSRPGSPSSNQPGAPGGQPSTLPQSRGGAFGDPDGRVVGPIAGVRSKSTEESLRVFMDNSTYDQWVFTFDMVSGHADVPDRPPIVPSGRTLGRPFRPGLTPTITFQPPPGQPGQPGQPARAGQGGNPGRVGRPVPGQGNAGRPALIPQGIGEDDNGGGRPSNPLNGLELPEGFGGNRGRSGQSGQPALPAQPQRGGGSAGDGDS